MRILLTEDDRMLGKAIKESLEIEGEVVDLVEDSESCETALATTNFDLLILDIGLPKKNGIEILKSIRLKNNNIPVILLTAYDGVLQKVNGLNVGADDYITKPFEMNELIARINSVFRRSKGNSTSVIKHNDVILDGISHKIFLKGEPISLISKEFRVLQILLENKDKVISKKSLEESLYSWDDSVESNAVEVHIHYLRKKLGHSLIKTVRGIGYIIES